MKKLFLIPIVIGFSLNSSFAQGKFSAGLEAAVSTQSLKPNQYFHDLEDFGIGGSVRYEAPLSEKLNWTATASFIYFITKNINGMSYWEYVIPAQGGMKYYFKKSFDGFYVGAELGIHYIIYKQGIFETYNKATDFSYAPSFGYHLRNFDISARYQFLSGADHSINYVGARIAYVFGKSK